MEQQPAKKRRGPASKLGKILINLIVTAVVGFLYFYVALPPSTCSPAIFIPSSASCVWCMSSAPDHLRHECGQQRWRPKEYLRFIKTQCLPVGILFLA